METVVEKKEVDLQVQLLACRVCLATDTKLFHLPTHPIAQTYALLTGTALTLTESQPQHICAVCSSQLLKYSALRAKCRTAEIILQVAHAENQLVTTDYLRNLDRTHLKHNLFLTNTQNIDIFPKRVKKKKPSFTQQKIDLTLEVQDVENIFLADNPIKDFDENKKKVFTEIIKSDDNTFGYTAENINYTSIKNDDVSSDMDIDESLLPDCLVEIGNDVFKDREENLKELKSKISKTDIKPEPKKKESVVSKTTTKERKIERHINRKPLKRVAQRRKMNRRVHEENQKKFTNDNDCKEEQFSELSKKYNIHIVILSKEEQLKQLEARKETEDYKNSQFKCETCFKGFVEESRLVSHMAVHDPTNRKLVCDICHWCYASKKNLNAHKRCHEMNITCKECNHVLKDIMEAKEHFNKHKGITFECEHCGKKFMKIKSKFEHCRIHHGYTPCPICGDRFVGQNGVTAHMKKSHKEAVDAVCSTCNVQFHSAEALSKHACEHGTLPCAQCGDSFPDEEALKEHQRVHRRKRKQVQKIKIEVKCLECGDSFCSEKRLRMHLSRVHNFKSPSTTQRRHNAGKTGDYKNKDVHTICICEMCGKFLMSPSALREHQRIHTGEKPFQCDHCPKSFRLKVQLQHHIYAHNDERPYKCPMCPKTYTQAISRDKHQLVHTKEGPYSCQLCGKTFQQARSRQMHIRKAHMKEAWPKRIQQRGKLSVI